MVGIDIVEIKRIKNLNDNGKLENKILSDREKDYLKSKSTKVVLDREFSEYDSSLAGFWAAKEAVLKAFGVGIKNINFKHVEIMHKESGAPYVKINKNLLDKICQKAPKNIEISITHDGGLAICICILN